MVLLFQHLKMWLQQQFALVLVFFYWKNVHFSHYLLNLHRPPLASSRDENNQLIQDSFTVLLKFFTRNAASQFCHFRISHLMCKQVFIISDNNTCFLKLPSEWIQLLHIFSFEVWTEESPAGSLQNLPNCWLYQTCEIILMVWSCDLYFG